MKGRIALIAALILSPCAPFAAAAAEFNVRSQSYLRLVHDWNLRSDNRNYLPFYEYVDVGAYDIGARGLSIHLSGWGRGDITSKGGNARRGDGEFVYGYLQWRAPSHDFGIKGGRQFVISGPAAMRGRYMDGLEIRGATAWGLGLEALAGSPVRSLTSGRSGDIVAQGRAFKRWGKSAEAGFSYAHARDDGERDQENVGFDLWLKPKRTIEGGLHGYYDIIAANFADAGALVRWAPLKVPWEFSARYSYITPSDFISRSSILFVFSDTAYHDLGVAATFFATRRVTMNIAGDWYRYSDGSNTSRIGADVEVRYGRRLRSSASFGLGRLKEFDSGLTQARLYSRFYPIRRLSLSGDIYGYFYDRAIRGRSFSFTAIAAVNYELPKGFVLTGAGDFSRNPYFDADAKGMLKLTYRFGGGSSAF